MHMPCHAYVMSQSHHDPPHALVPVDSRRASRCQDPLSFWLFDATCPACFGTLNRTHLPFLFSHFFFQVGTQLLRPEEMLVDSSGRTVVWKGEEWEVIEDSFGVEGIKALFSSCSFRRSAL